MTPDDVLYHATYTQHSKPNATPHPRQPFLGRPGHHISNVTHVPNGLLELWRRLIQLALHSPTSLKVCLSDRLSRTNVAQALQRSRL